MVLYIELPCPFIGLGGLQVGEPLRGGRTRCEDGFTTNFGLTAVESNPGDFRVLEA